MSFLNSENFLCCRPLGGQTGGLLLAGFRFTPHQHRPQHRAGKLNCFLDGKGLLGGL